MAGQLVQVATNTVTSAVASVTLTGIDSDDVYMVAINNVVPATDGNYIYARFTESGTPNSTANYDLAGKDLRASEAFGNDSYQNYTIIDLAFAVGNDTGEETGVILYIYNANNSSKYTFCTFENYYMVNTPKLRGKAGGAVFTQTSAVDGIQFFFGSSVNTASGTFTLYRVI
jgi:hypothetical protein